MQNNWEVLLLNQTKLNNNRTFKRALKTCGDLISYNSHPISDPWNRLELSAHIKVPEDLLPLPLPILFPI